MLASQSGLSCDKSQTPSAETTLTVIALSFVSLGKGSGVIVLLYSYRVLVVLVVVVQGFNFRTAFLSNSAPGQPDPPSCLCHADPEHRSQALFRTLVRSDLEPAGSSLYMSGGLWHGSS